MISDFDKLYVLLNEYIKRMRKRLISYESIEIVDDLREVDEKKCVNLVGSRLDSFLRNCLVASG